MKKAVVYNFQDTSQKNITANRGRLQLLGLAIHVAGDAYAHKTMCDPAETEAVYNKNKTAIDDGLNNGVTIGEIKEAIKNGLTTSALGTKFFENSPKGRKISNQYYADSVNYMGKRHSVATKVATNKLLNYYCNGSEFTPFVFCPYEISNDPEYQRNYSYKLRHLKGCMSSAGYNIFEYRQGKNYYTASAWQDLSYDY